MMILMELTGRVSSKPSTTQWKTKPKILGKLLKFETKQGQGLSWCWKRRHADTAWNWLPEHEEDFQRIKEVLSDTANLAPYDAKRRTEFNSLMQASWVSDSYSCSSMKSYRSGDLSGQTALPWKALKQGTTPSTWSCWDSHGHCSHVTSTWEETLDLWWRLTTTHWWGFAKRT